MLTRNLVTNDVALRALQTCRMGAAEALGRSPTSGPVRSGRRLKGAQLRVNEGSSGDDALGTQVLSLHSFGFAHLGRVGHSFYEVGWHLAERRGGA